MCGGIVNGLERGRQALLIDWKVCLGVWEGGIVNELERGRQAFKTDKQKKKYKKKRGTFGF